MLKLNMPLSSQIYQVDQRPAIIFKVDPRTIKISPLMMDNSESHVSSSNKKYEMIDYFSDPGEIQRGSGLVTFVPENPGDIGYLLSLVIQKKPARNTLGNFLMKLMLWLINSKNATIPNSTQNFLC